MFFSDAAFPSRMLFPLFPMDLPGISIFATAQPLAMALPANSSATAPRPATAPPQRPGQQQTSSGGEEYSGLASNLAHLGRIC